MNEALIELIEILESGRLNRDALAALKAKLKPKAKDAKGEKEKGDK